MIRLSSIFRPFALAIIFLLLPLYNFSQLSILAPNTNYTIDFTTTVNGVSNGRFDASGFQSSPAIGQLDSDAWAITGFSYGDLAFGGTQTTANTDYTRGTAYAYVGWGGIYALYGFPDPILGIQPVDDDFTQGTITLKIQNNTGGIINSLVLSYDVLICNDQDRSNSFNFSHSADDISYTSVSSLDFTSTTTKDKDADWIVYGRNTVLESLNIPDGSYYYLRWTGDDVGGSGSRDEFGLDNIVIASTTNDLTTLASSPSAQLPGGNISSLFDTPIESVDVFKILIEEASSDSQATQFTNIRLFPHSTNTALWSETIGGVRIYNSNTSTYITPSSTVITDDYLDIKMNPGDIEIADASSGSIIVSVYLKNSGLHDNTVLSFKVDTDNHGFLADPSGTGFDSDFGVADFNSGDFIVTILPTQVTFTTQPQHAVINQVFYPIPVVALTDANSNIDLNSSGTTIRMTSTGSLSNGGIIDESTNAEGLAVFNGIFETATGTGVELTAEDFNNVIGTAASTNSNAFHVYDVPSLIISEIAVPASSPSAVFVEIYNSGASDIDFGTDTWYLSYLLNDVFWVDVQLDITKTIAAGDAFVLCWNQVNFNSAYGFNADQVSAYVSISGGNTICLYKGGNHTAGALVDIYGFIGQWGGYEDWVYTASNAVRIRSIVSPRNDFTAAEWVIMYGFNDAMTPGRHAQNLIWTGGVDENYHDDINWSPTFSPDASSIITIPNTVITPKVRFGSCYDLTIEPGAKIAVDKYTVAHTMINNAGEGGVMLDLESGLTSSFITYNDHIDGTISVTIRNMNPFWALVSPPLENEVAGVFLGDYLDYWDEPTEKWVDILDETSSLTVMQGYAVQSSISTAQYNGKMRAGTISRALDYSVGDPDVYTGWNLLGNPYPSLIDWDNVTIPANMESGVSVWDGDGETYIAWNSQIADNEARYIQVGQGFFVRATATGVTLSFNDDVRTHDGWGYIDKRLGSNGVYPKNSMIIHASGNAKHDASYINFRDMAHWDYDIKMDVQKLFGNTDVPQIFSYINLENNEKAAINSVPFPQQEDRIALGFRVDVPGVYQLKFSHINSFDIRQPFFLLDIVSGQVYDLRKDSIINFDYANTDPEHRFDLCFDFTTEINEEEIIVKEKAWDVYSIKDCLFIQSKNEQEANMQIFNIQGQLVYSSSSILSFKSGQYLKLPSAYYLVRLVSDHDVQIDKVFIL